MTYARTEMATKFMPLLRHRFSQNARVVNALAVFMLVDPVMVDVDAVMKLSFARQYRRCVIAGASRQRVGFDYRFRSNARTTVVVSPDTTAGEGVAHPFAGCA